MYGRIGNNYNQYCSMVVTARYCHSNYPTVGIIVNLYTGSDWVRVNTKSTVPQVEKASPHLQRWGDALFLHEQAALGVRARQA